MFRVIDLWLNCVRKISPGEYLLYHSFMKFFHHFLYSLFDEQDGYSRAIWNTVNLFTCRGDLFDKCFPVLGGVSCYRKYDAAGNVYNDLFYFIRVPKYNARASGVAIKITRVHTQSVMQKP